MLFSTNHLHACARNETDRIRFSCEKRLDPTFVGRAVDGDALIRTA